MVKKEELLKDLKEVLLYEEEAVAAYSEFLKHLGWKKVVKKDFYDTIIAGLDMIKSEEAKHMRMMDDIFKYMEKSNKNEF